MAASKETQVVLHLHESLFLFLMSTTLQHSDLRDLRSKIRPEETYQNSIIVAYESLTKLAQTYYAAKRFSGSPAVLRIIL
jgi:hypothetical protein